MRATRLPRVRLSTLLTLCVGSQACGGAAIPTAALPAGTRVSIVSEDARIAGQSLAILALRSDAPAATFLETTRELWSAATGPAPMAASAEGWLVLSRITDDEIVTLQVRDAGGGATGLLTRWRRRPVQRPGDAALRALLPDSFERVHAMTSVDHGRRVATVVGRTTGDARSAFALVAQHLGALGYRRSLLEPALVDARGASVAVFHAAGREATVTVTARGAYSGVVLHLAERDR